MKIYLAARFSRLPELVGYADELEADGITVTSRWLRGGHEWVGTPDEDIPTERLAQFAQDDLEDIDDADVLVCFTEPARTGPARGGRHVEAGYALGTGKPVICVGHIENVFYALPQILRVDDWAHAHQLLINAAAGEREGVRSCRVCGCTDDWGCDEGCWWVAADLCSSCVGAAAEGVTA